MKIREAIVQQCSSVRVLIDGIVGQNNGDKVHAVSLGIGHKGISRVTGISGLPSQTAVIMQITCYQHFVMVVQPAFFICDVCLGFNVVFFANDTAEGFILERFPGNVGKVPGCGVVFRVVKAVGVDKMGIFAAQFLALAFIIFTKSGILPPTNSATPEETSLAEARRMAYRLCSIVSISPG